MTDQQFNSLTEAACHVLLTAGARAKAEASLAAADAWTSGTIPVIGDTAPPERPARPDRPELMPPSAMPRRRMGSQAGRVALLHAVAHIELNAIDLAWDIVARFPEMPHAFHDDWVRVGREEGTHFLLVDDRLQALGATYGDFPAHDGLWQSAIATADDIAARLAIVPMVLEARGLDVTPGMIDKLDRAGDTESADALRVIYREEVGHVATGKRWFDHVCAERGVDPLTTWRSLVSERFTGSLKPPFNDEARGRAGFDSAFYSGM